jgi:hypothetical protein
MAMKLERRAAIQQYPIIRKVSGKIHNKKRKKKLV